MLNKKILGCMIALSIVNPLVASADDTQTTVTRPTMSDSDITEKVKGLYAHSPLMKTSNITVSTHDGKVILTGKLETDMQYEEAISTAQSVDGVSDVDADALEVKESKAPVTDIYITAKVKGALIKEKLFGDKTVEYWPVHVETKDGVVYLTGEVETPEQQTNIVELVKKVHGVKSVNSTLTTK